MNECIFVVQIYCYNKCGVVMEELKTASTKSIHDFPTYGLFKSAVTKGHVGCPPCGPIHKFSYFKKVEEDCILWHL
jgi:hypothetical protein